LNIALQGGCWSVGVVVIVEEEEEKEEEDEEEVWGMESFLDK
jgi:hypothetical protein